jgi:hypothetical protein
LQGDRRMSRRRTDSNASRPSLFSVDHDRDLALTRFWDRIIALKTISVWVADYRGQAEMYAIAQLVFLWFFLGPRCRLHVHLANGQEADARGQGTTGPRLHRLAHRGAHERRRG